MRKTSQILLAAIVVGTILMGIGYAAVQNITLNISGTVAADPNQANFKVRFARTPAPTVSDSTYATAGITDDHNATINVSGLTAKDQSITATYTIENASADLSADLAISATNTNTEYFEISSQLAKTSLKAAETTTVTLTVKLIKTPLESVSSTVGVQMLAMAVQPGEEGSSGLTNDFSQVPETPLAVITNDNIGEYIDLGNQVIKTASTTDDWRILYKDSDYIYAILSDYLPATLIQESEFLQTNPSEHPYGITTIVSEAVQISYGLNKTSAWSSFANKIPGAVAYGGPSNEMLLNSYNTNNKTTFIYIQSMQKIAADSNDYDLYVPHSEIYQNCHGYFTSSTIGENYGAYWIKYDGIVEYASYYTDAYKYGIRPVVVIPNTTPYEYIDGIWTIK